MSGDKVFVSVRSMCMRGKNSRRPQIEDSKMNPNSIVRLNGPNKKAVGMGFVFARRRIATCSFVVANALGLKWDAPLSISGQAVAFELPLALSRQELSGRLVGQSVVERRSKETEIEKTEIGIVIIEAEINAEDILEPARMITGINLDFYFGRKIRFLANDGTMEFYMSGLLAGQVSNGLIQIETTSAVPLGSPGTPVWDVEASAVIGMLFYTYSNKNSPISFMVPISKLSEAWPDIDVQPISEHPSKPKPKIFICHAHEDAEVALQLYKRLNRLGYEPWIDKEKLLPGQSWDQE